MTTTFETAKVGDRVFHYRYGWSTITNIREESNYDTENVICIN